MPPRRFCFPVREVPDLPLESSTVSKDVAAKLSAGVPPGLDAPRQQKALYAVSRVAAQNDHFIGFYKTWTKSVNFLIGEHWKTKWDGTSLSWDVARDIPEWHQQPVTNLVYAVYRSALAKLTKQKPTLEVVPPSGNSEDKEAAELAEALLTFLWRYLRKPQKLPVLIGWLLVTSLGYIRVGWDPEGGEVKPRTIPMQRPRRPLVTPDELGPDVARGTSSEKDPEISDNETLQGAAAEGDTDEGVGGEDLEDVDVAADENGEPYTTDDGAIDYERAPDMEPPGEITWNAISPLCIRLNPEATSHEDAYEMYVLTLRPRAAVAEDFGIDESELDSANETAETIALYEDMMSASAAGFPRSWQDQTTTWGVSQQNAIGARVLVIEYYRKQCDKYPRGRHWITCGLKMVWPPESKAQAAKAERTADPGGDNNADDFPNGEAELPFNFWPPLVPVVDTPVPGQPTGVSLVSQVVPLNEQLNMLDGKISEKHAVDAFGGVWLASVEDKGIQFTSEPGQVVYSIAMSRRGQAFAPFQAKLNALPEAVYREREVMVNKVLTVAGMSGQDLSQRPEGTPSGRALLATQETSDAVLMPLLVALESALEESGRRELVIAQQKYREERTIAVRSQDGEWIFRSFKNADLRSGHDVRVQVGSSFPWSKSAQWDTRLELIRSLPQLVVGPDGTVDTQKLAKLMDAGAPGLGAFESDEDPDLMEIQREHAMFEAYDPSGEDGSHQVPQLAVWQVHAIHLQEHYNFMKKNWARFQRWHPAAQAAFVNHMQLTAMAIAEIAKGIVPPFVAGASLPSGQDGAGGAPPMPNGAAAPPGPPAPPAPGGLQLVKPEESKVGASPVRLTPADRAAAGV